MRFILTANTVFLCITSSQITKVNIIKSSLKVIFYYICANLDHNCAPDLLMKFYFFK